MLTNSGIELMEALREDDWVRTLSIAVKHSPDTAYLWVKTLQSTETAPPEELPDLVVANLLSCPDREVRQWVLRHYVGECQ